MCRVIEQQNVTLATRRACPLNRALLQRVRVIGLPEARPHNEGEGGLKHWQCYPRPPQSASVVQRACERRGRNVGLMLPSPSTEYDRFCNSREPKLTNSTLVSCNCKLQPWAFNHMYSCPFLFPSQLSSLGSCLLTLPGDALPQQRLINMYG